MNEDGYRTAIDHTGYLLGAYMNEAARKLGVESIGATELIGTERNRDEWGSEKAWVKSVIRKNSDKYRKIIVEALNEKEEPAMSVLKAECKGVTGELAKLEKKSVSPDCNVMLKRMTPETVYDISIYDSEKRAAISFAGVRLEDVKFLNGAVTFAE